MTEGKDMETRTIEAFLILANCLNFTKTAERVYISQPALSRQIDHLEDEFGCEFFVRNKRTVELTEYGKISIEYAQHICNEIDRWKLRLKQLQNNEAGRLRIGFLLDFPHDFFPRLIQEFSKKHPHVEMNFSDMDINGVVNGVLHGDLDCGFSLHNEIKKFDQINSLVVSSVKMCAVFPADHALAGRTSVKMEELADSDFVMVSTDNFAQGTLHIRFLCKMAGFEPKTVAHTSFVPSMLALIKCGVGIGVVAESAQGISPGGVCFVPIDSEYATMEILLFWKQQQQQKNPTLPLFIKTAESLL
jgi:DNA-binding transcriptional LysR family regulator